MAQTLGKFTLKDKHILIVDDSDTIRTYVKGILESLESKVEGASTGTDGLEKSLITNYDLILLDLMLPDLDGIEVLRRFRQKNNTTAVVMFTEFGGIKSAISAVQLGADGYIEKQNIAGADYDHTEFLYALNQALEHRAGIVAQKQLEEMRVDFYSMLTHNMRNPTNVILGITQTLLEGRAEPLTPNQRELVSIIEVSANQLLRLINEYLDFSKIDVGYFRLSLSEVDLCSLVKSIIQLIQLQAQAKKQTLTVNLPSEPISAYIDAERIEQLLNNLLSNAIKFTPDGGNITFDLKVEDEYFIFCVSDTGIGIPQERISNLFAKYRSVSSKVARSINDGSGMGLTIVKEIVDAHGGTIQVKSEGIPGKGTTFTVKIPLKQKIPTLLTKPETSVQSIPIITQNGKSVVPDLSQDPRFRQIFIAECKRHILTLQDAISHLYNAPDDTRLLKTAQLASHTLKGIAGTMRQTSAFETASQMDNILKQASKGTIALNKSHLDNLTKLLDDITKTLI